MRLTLRTMLAFMDDMLEPADAQEVGKKIEESEFATSQMHRMRDVTRRLRLGAPKLDGRGMGLDPNTVAEYLDNVLPAERVPDFEKVCLESDVHLAEVASAHQILTLVLGEPAEVDPELRRRMYDVAAQAEAEIDTPLESAESAAAPAIAVRSAGSKRKGKRRRPEVPDYLRERPQRRAWLPLAAVAAALLVLAGTTAFFVLGGPDRFRQIAMNMQKERAPEVPATPPVGGDAGAPAEGVDSSTPPAPGDIAANEPAPNDTSPDVAPPVDATTSTSPTENVPQTAPPPVLQPVEATAAKMPPTEAPSGEAPAPPMPAAAPPVAASATDEPPAATATDSDAPPAEAPPPAAQPVGRLATDMQVLLRMAPTAPAADPTAGPEWTRVSTRDTLLEGDQLVVLPTFRTNVVLTTDGGAVNALIIGGADLALEGPDAEGIAGFQITDGRLIFDTAGKAGVRLRIGWGKQQAIVMLDGDDAALAIDVRRALIDGADPEATPASVRVDLFVPRGNVRWKPVPMGTEETLKAGETWTLEPGAPLISRVNAAGTTMPEWVASPSPGPNEKRTSDDVAVELELGKPVGLRLKELAYRDRRVDVRSLASRCLSQCGDYETFLPLMTVDASLKSYWTSQIETVRAAIARGPQEATRLRLTMEGQRDTRKAADLYRMVWGYNADQLRKGAAALLVNNLDHQDQDMRVLSFWNLRAHSVGSLRYQPEYPEAKRREGVRAWKQRLEQGGIVPLAPNG